MQQGQVATKTVELSKVSVQNIAIRILQFQNGKLYSSSLWVALHCLFKLIVIFGKPNYELHHLQYWYY